MGMVSRTIEAIVAIIITVATVILMGALSAKVFEDLWAWFVVTLERRPFNPTHIRLARRYYGIHREYRGRRSIRRALVWRRRDYDRLC